MTDVDNQTPAAEPDPGAPTQAAATTDAPGPDGTEPPDPRAAKASRRRRATIEWIVLIGAALIIALVIKTFLFQAFYIPSESMVPTLKVGDRVLVNKLSYDLHDVHRGDIVVFKAPPEASSDGIDDLVKRVVGLPGDTVEARDDGRVYVNDRRLEEPYLPDATRTAEFPATKVPAGHLFMMGDNRGASRDSRYFGPIAESAIIGRVFLRIWPPGSIGLM